MKKYKLIANPAARRGTAKAVIQKTFELFRKKGVVFDLELTRGPKDAARIARTASREFDVIVAVGGDGTVNETIPGLLFSGKPLGIIPGGSGNDFIKSLNIPNNIETAVDIVLQARTKVIDVGRINGTYFANAVGFGFDAAVNEASCGINHSRRGLLLYLCAMLGTLGKYNPVSMKVSMNGETIVEDTFLLSVGNGATVGGGFKLTPRAKLDDHVLDVTMVKPLRLLPLLWHLPKVFAGTIDRVKKYAVLRRTTMLTVESTEPLPVHVDGEIYTEEKNRFKIEVVPHALTVIGNY